MTSLAQAKSCDNIWINSIKFVNKLHESHNRQLDRALPTFTRRNIPRYVKSRLTLMHYFYCLSSYQILTVLEQHRLEKPGNRVFPTLLNEVDDLYGSYLCSNAVIPIVTVISLEKQESIYNRLCFHYRVLRCAEPISR